MNMLASLASDSSIANETDSVGGGSAPLESGLYGLSVSMAYITKSKGGAMGLVITLAGQDKREVRQTLWMTSGTDKGCKNYYEKDGEKHFLPGFNHANALCLLTVGKEISGMDTEQKVIKLYNPEAKAEVPTKVDVLTELIGKEILVGLLKQTVDKTKKNDAGVYEATGETRDENEIDKLFRASDRMTTAEIRAQATEAAFADTWEAKWTGKTRNKAKGVSANSGTFGAPKATSAATKKPANSLFA